MPERHPLSFSAILSRRAQRILNWWYCIASSPPRNGRLPGGTRRSHAPRWVPGGRGWSSASGPSGIRSGHTAATSSARRHQATRTSRLSWRSGVRRCHRGVRVLAHRPIPHSGLRIGGALADTGGVGPLRHPSHPRAWGWRAVARVTFWPNSASSLSIADIRPPGARRAASAIAKMIPLILFWSLAGSSREKRILSPVGVNSVAL